MRSRILELDALRGLAAFAVVLYHYTTRYSDLYGYANPPAFDFPLGHYGVQLFFVVSGFVIFLTLNNCKHPADFVVSRFARLYPVYWAAVAITFTTVTFFGLAGREATPLEALANLTMLQGFVKIPDVDGVYWTLKWELVFYFWALMIFIFNLQRHILILCAGLLASQWMVWGFEQTVRTLPAIIKLASLNTYGNLFTAGILFYLLMHNDKRQVIHVLIAVAAFNQYLLNDLESFYVTIGIFAIFYLFAFGKLGFIAVKPLIVLGTISYSLYLIHEYVGWIAIREMINAGMNTNLAIAITTVGAIGLASILTYGVEHRGMNLIKNRYKTKYRHRVVTPTKP